MNNLIKRIITGIFYGGLVMGSIWSSPIFFFALFFIFQFQCLSEFYQLANRENILPYSFSGIFSSNLFFLSSVLCLYNLTSNYIYFLPALMLYIIFVESLYSHHIHPFSNIAFTVLGVFYLSLPFVCLNYMAFYPDSSFNSPLITGYLLLIWMYDSGSYLVGTIIGKHKLFERISPNKTWEGLAGGSFICICSSYFISLFIFELTLSQWFIISLLIVVTGTYGDLAKSLLKRSVGVKDSGTILPGHGGILDRLDSFLFSAPFVMAYLILIRYTIFQ